MAASSTPGGVVLEDFTALRDSILWRLQTAFYNDVSIEAWSKAIVPNFVSSNSFLAKCYARMILAYVRDWFLGNGAADPSQPVYIIEVGAGHGKLTHLLLHHLADMKEAWPEGVEQPFVVVMTDFTQNNVDFWMAHEPLKAHVESGMLDMAVFDAVYDRSLRLLHSKKVLNPSSLANPVVAITNYIFDTLPHDAFRVAGGAVHQAKVRTSTGSASAEAQAVLAGAGDKPLAPHSVPAEAGMIKRLGCEWEYEEVSVPDLPGPYAADDTLGSVVQWYADHTEESSVLLPIGGMALLNNLLALSRGKAMVLIGDKAYSKLSELQGRRDPHVALHGSFSLMVNLHAVQLYAEARGGMAMITPYVDGFKCAAVVFGTPAEGVMETRLAWEDVMSVFGPENFSCIQRCIKDETADPSLATALAVIRAAQWDSDVFYKFKTTILSKSSAATVPDKLKADLYQDVCRIAETYYPLQGNKDISFELARVLMGLARYEEAVAGFLRSVAQCGEHHVTWYNVALCRFHQGNFPVAKELFTKSLQQSGGKYDNARVWLEKTEEKLAGAAAPAEVAAE